MNVHSPEPSRSDAERAIDVLRRWLAGASDAEKASVDEELVRQFSPAALAVLSREYPEDFTVDDAYRAGLPDLQNGPASLIRGAKQDIQHVGISNFRLPIRYRTRDLTRLLPGTARTMRRMDRITGRSDDMLIIRGVNVFPTQIEEQIIGVEGLAPHYLIEVRRDGNLDKMRVQVESQESMDDSAKQATAKELQHHIKSMIGVSTAIDIVGPGEIPRSEGKAKRVIDHRKS